MKEGKRKTENEEKGSDLAVGCSDILQGVILYKVAPPL